MTKLMEITLLKRIIEAALLAAGQPLTVVQLSALFGEGEPVGIDAIAQALAELQADTDGRGVELVEVASGFRYQVRTDVHAWVARLWTERQTKYSRALLETLALIAYRQPITRAEIEQIRGVAVSSNIIRTLEEREWVRVVGHRDVPGKPALFGTTRQFLDYFSLKSLDELPPLAEIRDLEDLEPQLDLPEALADGIATAIDEERGAIVAALPETDTSPNADSIDDEAANDTLVDDTVDSEIDVEASTDADDADIDPEPLPADTSADSDETRVVQETTADAAADFDNTHFPQDTSTDDESDPSAGAREKSA
jgi:segregation and condensation protein B